MYKFAWLDFYFLIPRYKGRVLFFQTLFKPNNPNLTCNVVFGDTLVWDHVLNNMNYWFFIYVYTYLLRGTSFIFV